MYILLVIYIIRSMLFCQLSKASLSKFLCFLDLENISLASTVSLQIKFPICVCVGEWGQAPPPVGVKINQTETTQMRIVEECWQKKWGVPLGWKMLEWKAPVVVRTRESTKPTERSAPLSIHPIQYNWLTIIPHPLLLLFFIILS